MTVAREPRLTDGNRPTVAHLSLVYLPRSETFVYNVLRFQRRFRPIVVARRTANLQEFPLSDVHELVPPAPALVRLARRLRANAAGYRTTYQYGVAREARRNEAKLLHAHFGWAGWLALAPRRRLGIPLVTTFYGFDLSFPESDPDWGPRYEALFRDGSRFICEGPTMLRHLQAIGCPREKARIVRIGIDVSQFPFRPPARARPLIVIQGARFVEKKGVDLSIRAFAAARDRLGPSELWLIGDGPERERLERLTGELGVESAVRFHGMLSHADYRALLERAHIAIQPSRTASNGDTEGGAPTVLLEMQATGIPIIATRHADIPFVVADSDELVPEEDVDGLAARLVELAGLPEDEWTARAERGRAFIAENHDAHIIGTRIEDLYAEALGEAG